MRSLVFFVVVVSVLCGSLACTPEADNARAAHPAIAGYAAYDATQNGEQQVDAATARARAENKRVLLVFGGNWCAWCRRLDDVLAGDGVKPEVDKHWVVAHVDSDTNGKLNERYNNPFSNGFPVLLVLDGDGKVLHVQDTGGLEKDNHAVGYDVDKTLTFLKSYAPL